CHQPRRSGGRWRSLGRGTLPCNARRARSPGGTARLLETDRQAGQRQHDVSGRGSSAGPTAPALRSRGERGDGSDRRVVCGGLRGQGAGSGPACLVPGCLPDAALYRAAVRRVGMVPGSRALVHVRGRGRGLGRCDEASRPRIVEVPMPGRTIVMLVTSGGLNDPRVRRSMRAASRAGLEVRLVCRSLSRLQADSVKAPPTQVHYVPRAPGFGVLKRLFPGWPQTQPTGRGTGDSALPASSAAGPLWLRPRELWTLLGIAWFNVLAVLKVWRYPAILVHANDLDTLAAGVILSRFKRAPLLYDAHELFTAQFTSASRQFRAILFGLEHRLIRRTDCVVTVNQSIADTLAAWHGVPVPRVVMNCPSVQELARADSGRLGSRRESVMRVIYQGVYRTERGLEELILSA